MRATTLTDRAIVRLSGDGVRDFLQGLVTRDVEGDADDDLIKRLSIYRLRRPITIARDDNLAVHWSSDGDVGMIDPRLAGLGRRWLAPPEAPATGWLKHRLRL